MLPPTVAATPKGQETRRRIISSTRELFYRQGYEATSIQDICRLAEVKAGTLTYYFKTKYDLVRELYGSVFRRSYEFVDRHLDRPVNSLEKNTIVAFIYCHAICADEKTRQFHLEILERGSVSDYIFEIAFPISEQFLRDFNLGFTPRELRDIDLAENGISRELFAHFLKNPEGRTVRELVNTIYIFRARLFTVDENTMKVYLYNGMDFDRTFNHSHLTLLGPDLAD